MPDIEKLRQDTPGCANCVHFDNASAGLMPRPVLDAMLEHLNRESRVGGYQIADDAADAVREVYALVARLTCALPRNIALVENATAAFFQALSGFDFQP